MILKNRSARLVTINGPMVEVKRGDKVQFKQGKSYKIKPGANPQATEVPDEVCRNNKFVESLVTEGVLEVVEDIKPLESIVDDNDNNEHDEYGEMSKAELVDIAEAMGIQVKSKMTKPEIIDAIVAL